MVWCEITFAMSESVIPCEFACKIISDHNGFEEGESTPLIKGEDVIPINQKLGLNSGENAEITVQIFALCPERKKSLYQKM